MPCPSDRFARCITSCPSSRSCSLSRSPNPTLPTCAAKFASVLQPITRRPRAEPRFPPPAVVQISTFLHARRQFVQKVRNGLQNRREENSLLAELQIRKTHLPVGGSAHGFPFFPVRILCCFKAWT